MNDTSSNKLPIRDIAYFRQRQKNRVFQSVLAHFAALAGTSGLTKKELAIRLGKDPAQLTRWFSGPGNWTLDTISDLLLAMNAEMKYEICPLDDNKCDASIFVIENHRPYSISGSRESETLMYKNG